MKVRWADEALSDLERLHDFLAPQNKTAAKAVVKSLRKATIKLASHPRIGLKLEGYEAREVRRIIVASYEIRYEIYGDMIRVLNLWHTREMR